MYVRPDVYKEIEENDIDDVVFQVPFLDETRKSKRNLLVAGFTALMIASLDLRISGFLGLQTGTGSSLGAAITRGLACLIVFYFLATFIFNAYVDYSAWKFKREKVLIKPYLSLISMLEAHFHQTGEQIYNASTLLSDLPLDREMQAEIYVQESIKSASGQIKNIGKNIDDLYSEIRPLLTHWSKIVKKTERLNWRLRMRFASLWALDILLPTVVAVLAIWKTYTGIPFVLSKILG